MNPLAILVKNDRFTSKYQIEVLEKAGFRVLFCRNTGKFFKAMNEETPAIVIMGTALAHGDELSERQTQGGAFTCGLLSSLIRQTHPGLPIIVLSMKKWVMQVLNARNDRFLKVLDSWSNSLLTELSQTALLMTKTCKRNR